MATLKPKKTKIEDTVVGAYQKIEDTVVGTYQKIEDAVVGTYQKIEDKFVEKFLDVEEEIIEIPEGETKQMAEAKARQEAAQKRIDEAKSNK